MHIPPFGLGGDCSARLTLSEEIVEAESPKSGRDREVVSLSEGATAAEKDLIAETTNRIARTTQSLDPSFAVSS